jgi:hypothetical protein
MNRETFLSLARVKKPCRKLIYEITLPYRANIEARDRRELYCTVRH